MPSKEFVFHTSKNLTLLSICVGMTWILLCAVSDSLQKPEKKLELLDALAQESPRWLWLFSA
jgi:hypothetical protein